MKTRALKLKNLKLHEKPIFTEIVIIIIIIICIEEEVYILSDPAHSSAT